MVKPPTQNNSAHIILGERLTLGQFVLTEAALYFAQTLVFVIVAALMTGFLTKEDALQEFVNAKINDKTMLEFGATVMALLRSAWRHFHGCARSR